MKIWTWTEGPLLPLSSPIIFQRTVPFTRKIQTSIAENICQYTVNQISTFAYRTMWLTWKNMWNQIRYSVYLMSLNRYASQECIPMGCVLPACWPYPSMHCAGGCLPGEVSAYGVSAQGGWCLLRVGGVCPGWVVSAQGGWCLPGGNALATGKGMHSSLEGSIN